MSDEQTAPVEPNLDTRPAPVVQTTQYAEQERLAVDTLRQALTDAALPDHDGIEHVDEPVEWQTAQMAPVPAAPPRYVSVYPHYLQDHEHFADAVAQVLPNGALIVYPLGPDGRTDHGRPPIKGYAPGSWITFEHVGDYTPPAPEKPSVEEYNRQRQLDKISMRPYMSGPEALTRDTESAPPTHDQQPDGTMRQRPATRPRPERIPTDVGTRTSEYMLQPRKSRPQPRIAVITDPEGGGVRDPKAEDATVDRWSLRRFWQRMADTLKTPDEWNDPGVLR